MRTRFIVSAEDIASFTDYQNVFESHYKKNGFSFNEEDEDIFIEFDSLIPLNVDDYIFHKGVGTCIITYKCYDIDDDVMIYAFKME